MRLGETWAVVNEFHLVSGDVDELVVLRMQRPHWQEPVLGELVQRQQPLAVRFLSLAHAAVVVPGLIVHVKLLNDRIDLLALIRPARLIDVPLAYLAVEKMVV